MGESKKMEMEDIISYSDDLVTLLKNRNETNDLNNCVDISNQLRSLCLSDQSQLNTSLKDYQEKINLCKQKTEACKAEVASDAEIHSLQKELDEELHKESLLQEELRAITNQINNLEEQRSSIEERRQVLKKLEQDEKKTQMKLSMYASVTKIIPDLNDQFKISGAIVDKEKKTVEKFELSSQEMSDFDTCNAVWKMIT
ncbi:hypothetical protein CTI12_AA433710 [Artemisia annua]|uniref:Kinetochore protein Spc24 n=1 Tax=Artemisia annua TaxID=35608 RepID=A0A2U1M097_ARTAN|nr:hypothetical protein CTI12_AA433710 [Artemisia annua]